jgi:hypothetical protein
MAPILPDAAEMPWHVERYRVGKSSLGMMKLVVLGPKLAKKPAKQKRKSIAFAPGEAPKSVVAVAALFGTTWLKIKPR